MSAGTWATPGLAAMSGSTTFDTTYTTLGVHGSYALMGSLTARATLGWRYAFGDVTPVTTLAFQPAGAAFGLAGSPIARDALVTELGVDYAIGRNATIGLAYSGQSPTMLTRTPPKQTSPCGFERDGRRRTVSAPIVLNRAGWNVRLTCAP